MHKKPGGALVSNDRRDVNVEPETKSFLKKKKFKLKRMDDGGVREINNGDVSGVVRDVA